jgi:hypothetical protein
MESRKKSRARNAGVGIGPALVRANDGEKVLSLPEFFHRVKADFPAPRVIVAKTLGHGTRLWITSRFLSDFGSRNAWK